MILPRLYVQERPAKALLLLSLRRGGRRELQKQNRTWINRMDRIFIFGFILFIHI